MHPTNNQLPTLGYLNKVLCECLGLWSSDSEDITFKVTATEKERRIALQQAFEEIKKEDGAYDSLDDLIEVTTRLAPEDTQKVKKSRTIQTYVNHLSKTDFESLDEYLELSQYIKVLLTKRYSDWEVSELALNFYASALAHYREFVREHASNTQDQKSSYLSFLRHDLRILIAAITRQRSEDDTWSDAMWDDQWPLRSFADAACQRTGISLYKLHQYHEFQRKKRLGEQAWICDFTAQQVNTQSKQVINRLSKSSRMKWEIFYPTLKPLADHPSKAISKESLAFHAFGAMIVHNLNVHIEDCGPFDLPARGSLTNQVKLSNSMPSSDYLDYERDGYSEILETYTQQATNRYQTLLDGIRRLPSSLSFATDIPNSLDLIYKTEHRRFNEGTWHVGFVDSPNWITEWVLAREAFFAGDAPMALSHFKTALEQAKYVAGPLFIPFYIQVCAFCKSQYKLLSARKEEKLFERFYEGLGKNAANYAQLVGYTPMSVRDPKTLMPHVLLPIKEKLIIKEIDELARDWYL